MAVNKTIDILVEVSNNTPLREIFNGEKFPFSEIRRAYCRMAITCHPDKCQDRAEDAKRAMQHLSQAYSIAEQYAQFASEKMNVEKKDVVIPNTLVYKTDNIELEEHLGNEIEEHCVVVIVVSDDDESDDEDECGHTKDHNDICDVDDESQNRTSNQNSNCPSPRDDSDNSDDCRRNRSDETNGGSFTNDRENDDGPSMDYYADPNSLEEMIDEFLGRERGYISGESDEEEGREHTSASSTRDGFVEFVEAPIVSDDGEQWNGRDGGSDNSRQITDDNDADGNRERRGVEGCENSELRGGQTNENDGVSNDVEETEETERRRMLRRLYKKRILEEARDALENERGASKAWQPRRACENELCKGHTFPSRWQCERAFREHAAWHGVWNGIKIHSTAEFIAMKCRTKRCVGRGRFTRRVRSGMWVMSTFSQHSLNCLNNLNSMDGTGTVNSYTSPYTPEQISRVLSTDVNENNCISAVQISSIIRSKEIYTRHPPMRFFRAARKVILEGTTRNRAVQMAAMPGFMGLLRECGHKVSLLTMDAKEMRETRLKAAKFIFDQSRKAGFLDDSERFEKSDVDVSDITEGKVYYAGFTFTASIAEHMAQKCRKVSSADAAHCQGVGPQSYGTTFEMVLYDTNNHLVPIWFMHSVGTECAEVWEVIFRSAQEVDGFDCVGRVTVTDQEKGIDKAFKKVMANAALFLDVLHVKKNMLPVLGVERAMGGALYDRAVYEPSPSRCDAIRAQYGPKQKEYLSRFPDHSLYRSFSSLEDTITTSQGAESQMRASLRNSIRSAEPQQMLWTLVSVQRKRFYERKRNALRCTSPVPPNVERHIAMLITKSAPYQQSVQFVESSDMMEATVASQRDATQIRRVIFSGQEQTPPACCAYSRSGDGFPCWHGVAVICQKHGAQYVHNYVAERHLTKTWKAQYEGVEYNIPSQESIDRIFITAARLAENEESVQIPVALAPPRGRPPKDASRRLKSWYEKGGSHLKKRRYGCSLCGLEGHRMNVCTLKQAFDEELDDIRGRKRPRREEPGSTINKLHSE